MVARRSPGGERRFVFNRNGLMECRAPIRRPEVMAHPRQGAGASAATVAMENNS